MSADPNSLTSQAYALWQRVKAIFPTAIFTSGARDFVPLGGSQTSQHLSGNAFDFQVPGVDPKNVQATLIARGVQFGQSITEYGLSRNPVNHLGVGTKGQVMTASKGSYRTLGYVPAGYTAQPGATAFGGTDLGAFHMPTVAELLGGPGGVGDLLQMPAKALEGVPILGNVVNNKPIVDWDDWFRRAALVIFALIFIAAALFMFKGSDMLNVAKGIAK